jgi:hypothetical protein
LSREDDAVLIVAPGKVAGDETVETVERRPRKITRKGNLLLLAFNRISIFKIAEHGKEGCIIPKRPRCEALAKWRVTKLHVGTGA